MGFNSGFKGLIGTEMLQQSSLGSNRGLPPAYERWTWWFLSNSLYVRY